MWLVSQVTLVVTLCTRLGSCEESSARLEDDPLMRGWMDHVHSFPVHLMQDVAAEKSSADSANYKFEVQWFNQRLDHVNRQQLGRWWQRYFVYDKFSRLEQNYPLFVFCGGEQGDIYREWDHLGFMLKVARSHGAKVLWLEHRFFGQSVPFKGNDAFATRVDRVGLLSLEQSLADYAAIVRKHQGEGPVLTFGGSLSGTIAAMMRIQYPTVVDMAFASSAPILGVDGVADPFAWRARVTANFAELGSPSCPNAVRRGFAAISAAVADPNGEAGQRMRKAATPCEQEPISAARWNMILGLAWSNLEALGNYIYPASKSGIGAACKRMEAAASGEDVFPALLRLGRGSAQGNSSTCLNFTQMEGGGQTSSPVGLGWSYMACTEVIHPIGANNKTDMFPPYEWTVDGLAASCTKGWRVAPDASYLKRKLGVEVRGFGSKAKVQRSRNLPGRVLFTYGTYDPWGTMVPKQGWSDDVEIIKVPGGSHCSDLETPRSEDTSSMVEARQKIATVLSKWIEDVRKLRVMKVNNFGSGRTVGQPVDVKGFGKTLRGNGNGKLSPTE